MFRDNERSRAYFRTRSDRPRSHISRRWIRLALVLHYVGEVGMRARVFVAIALGLWLVTVVRSPAATSTGEDSMKRLIQAAYFSDACRSEAEALGIAATTDASTLVTAFVAVRGLVRAAPKTDARRDDCREPVILLINLLRLNGISAELAFASNELTNAATVDSAPLGKSDRLLVYVPSLDSYFDPAVRRGEQAALDRVTVEQATWIHILGPSLADDARGGCRSTCMNVYGPRGQSSVRVRTEAIRGH